MLFEVISITLFGALLRFACLGCESLWLDETSSLERATTHTLWGIATMSLSDDPHPPLYFVLLGGWTTLVGTSEVALRSLSAILGVATIPFAYGIGHRLFSHQGGLLAAGLLSLSTFHIWYSQDARMYALMTFLTVVSYYFLVRIGDSGDEPSRRDIVVYILATGLVGYAHVLGLFVILAQNIYIVFSYLPLITRQRSTHSQHSSIDINLHTWILLQGGVSIVLAPWLLKLTIYIIEAMNGPKAAGAGWLTAPSTRDIFHTLVSYFGFDFFFSIDFPFVSHLFWFATFFIVLLINIAVLIDIVGEARQRFISLRQGQKTGHDHHRERPSDRVAEHNWGVISNQTAFLLSWAGVPIIAPFVLSYLVEPMYLSRYTIPALFGVILLIVQGLEAITSGFPWMGYVCVAIMLLVATPPLYPYYVYDQKEQWDEVAAYIESHAASDELVVISEKYMRKAYVYYADHQERKYEIIALRGNTAPVQIREDVAGYSGVWLVLSNIDSSDAEKFYRVTEGTDEYTQAGQKEFIGITVIYFRNHSGEPSEFSIGTERDGRGVYASDRPASE